MPLYKYIAVAPGHAPREIDVEAENTAEAVNKLRSTGLRPVRFIGEADNESGALSFRRTKIDAYEFTTQLAPLLSANIPLERALAIIAESSTQPQQRQFVNGLRQGLHEGKKLSELVRSYGGVFPGYYANLIETGEETGCLPEVTEELNKFMEESKELKEFIISSSVYPAVILCVTLLVMILMFTVFIPKFAQIFTDMGREQPGSMVFLLTLSSVMTWLVLAGIPALIGGWIVLYKAVGRAVIVEWKNALLLKLPIFGTLSVKLEMSKFIRTLAILMSNHVDLIKTVRISTRVIQNTIIRQSFAGLEGKLKSGEKLSASLQGNEFIPAGMVAKIRVGEESGEVGQMLERVAGHQEEETRRRIKRLLSLFEPAVIVFLAGMVLIVVVSIFMAIMELNEINT